MKKIFFTERLDLYDNSSFSKEGVEVHRYTLAMKKNFLLWLRNAGTAGIAYDIETVGDQFNGQIVLHSFSDSTKMTICFDGFSYDVASITDSKNLWGTTTMIAHSAQYEMKWLDAADMLEGELRNRREMFTPTNTYCTMVAEQKIYQGISSTDKSFSFSLVNTLVRANMSLPPGMNKTIREDFVVGYSQHTVDHVLYNMSDVLALHELKDKQRVHIDNLKLKFLIFGIQMPLVRILAQMENNGWEMNEDIFLGLAKQAEKKMNIISKQLTAYAINKMGAIPSIFNVEYNTKLSKLARRRDRDMKAMVKVLDNLESLRANNKTHLKSYTTMIAREAKLINAAEGYLVELEALTKCRNTVGLNWSSSNQIVDLLKSVNFNPIPKAKSATTKKIQPSTSKVARSTWMIENHNHPHFEFIELLDDYNKLAKHVNSFGETFIQKYKHTTTGKFHTTYKQATTATGRLASGAVESRRFNSQQIIAINDIRNCFVGGKGRSVGTADYSSIEMIIVCALADDQKLLAISKGDVHSHFANLGWKAIHASRGNSWEAHQIISSTQNKLQRTDYKPMLFGYLYGLRAKKAGETLKVTPAEGQIAMNTIGNEIPASLSLVIKAAHEAKATGAVVFNNRTNSRRWFKPLIDAMNNKRVPFAFISAAESAARNARIQGTGADIMMEALVSIDRWVRLYKIDLKWKLQVHDELVFDFPEGQDWIAHQVVKIMVNVANLYFKSYSTVKAGASLEIKPYWVK